MGRNKKRPREQGGGSSSHGNTERAAMPPNNGEPSMQADMMNTLLQRIVSLQQSMESMQKQTMVSMESMQKQTMESIQTAVKRVNDELRKDIDGVKEMFEKTAKELEERLEKTTKELEARVNDKLRKDTDGVKEMFEKTTKEMEELKQASWSQLNQTEERMAQAESPMKTQLYQFKFRGEVNDTVYTRTKIETDKNDSIVVDLLCDGKQLERDDPFCSIEAQLFLLGGDFEGTDKEDYFVSKIITPGQGKPEIKNNSKFQLTNGTFSFSDLEIKNNSKRKHIRLGVRAATTKEERNQRIVEGISNAFKVKEFKTKQLEKHKTPSLADDIWRLEVVRKGSDAMDTLGKRGIETVGQLLTRYNQDEDGLRKILREKCHYRVTSIERILTNAFNFKIEGEVLFCYTENGKKLFFIPEKFIIAGMEYSGRYSPFAELTMSEKIEAKTLLKNSREKDAKCYGGYKIVDGRPVPTEASSSQQNSFSNPQSAVDNMQMGDGCGQSSHPFPNDGGNNSVPGYAFFLNGGIDDMFPSNEGGFNSSNAGGLPLHGENGGAFPSNVAGGLINSSNAGCSMLPEGNGGAFLSNAFACAPSSDGGYNPSNAGHPIHGQNAFPSNAYACDGGYNPSNAGHPIHGHNAHVMLGEPTAPCYGRWNHQN